MPLLFVLGAGFRNTRLLGRKILPFGHTLEYNKERYLRLLVRLPLAFQTRVSAPLLVERDCDTMDIACPQMLMIEDLSQIAKQSFSSKCGEMR